MPHAAKTANILIVDDDAGLLRLIEKVLRRAGHRTLAAISGDAALLLAEQNVDLVLLDLGMPNMDGRSLASRLTQRIPRMPFVVITGRTDVQTAVDMMRQGALDYLMKDAQFMDFLPPVVERALAQIERERQLREAEDALRRLNAELEQRVRNRTSDLQTRNRELREALDKVRILSGLLPTCSYCKNIKDESGRWHPIEQYIAERSEAEFSHGLCPECLKKHYPDIAAEVMLRSSRRQGPSSLPLP